MGSIQKIKNFIKSPDSYTMLIVPLTFLPSLNSILFFWYYKSDYHNLGAFKCSSLIILVLTTPLSWYLSYRFRKTWKEETLQQLRNDKRI